MAKLGGFSPGPNKVLPDRLTILISVDSVLLMNDAARKAIDGLLREMAKAAHPATNALSGLLLEHQALFEVTGRAAMYATHNGGAISCEAADVIAEVKAGTIGCSL